MLQYNLNIYVQSDSASLLIEVQGPLSLNLPLLSYLSTGPVSFRGELQLKLAEVGPGRPTRFKWSCSTSGGAPSVRYEPDALTVAPATLAVISQ